MTALFGIGFLSPWLLLALLGLPILWMLLRAVPPAAKRQVFPAITLLLGLRDQEQIVDRTPWWLLALRLFAVAAVIIGFSGPILNPTTRIDSQRPLLIVSDASWAGAASWDVTRTQMEAAVQEASLIGRPVALLQLTAPAALQFQPAQDILPLVSGVAPVPWQPDTDLLKASVKMARETDFAFDSLWISDGITYDAAETTRSELIEVLAGKGNLEVLELGQAVLAQQPPRFEDGRIILTVQRSDTGVEQPLTLQALGLAPTGQEQIMASVENTFPASEHTINVPLVLPSELRARVNRFVISGVRSAGAIALSDDRLRRRKVALIAPDAGNEGLALLSPLHYLERALAPNADLLTGGLADILPANPDVVILADVAQFTPTQAVELQAWVQEGGLLLRFAGARLAAADTARNQIEPLMPIRLRAGGRNVGGAMSWGAPKHLAPFAETSPFYKLSIPEDVTVSSQVMAQPDPELASRVIAELADGTPLVTRKRLGQGQVILFHVTANAEWSSLPLSGLFVDMLDRLAVSSSTAVRQEQDLAGTIWQPVQVLDGFGRLSDAGILPGIDGVDLVSGVTGPDLRAGLYLSDNRSFARNILTEASVLEPVNWPATVAVQGYQDAQERPMMGSLLSVALVALMIDIIATIFLSGLGSKRSGKTQSLGGIGFLCVLVGLGLGADPLSAQTQAPSPNADSIAEIASQMRLAHVLTGNSDVDRTAHAGLSGLSDILHFRTSVEAGEPYGVDLERDELAFFPMLYWPVTTTQTIPSSAAYERLNTYLRNGGMILFDTRDADLVNAGQNSSTSRRLQQLALPLSIPPLEQVPQDHVLTRAFYLLQDFPGRYARGPVWVEAAPNNDGQVDGVPFRNLNDGVSPVVIGGNDWAAAWAVDDQGRSIYPVGRGYTGERQRELARRFGVNLIMHVLTGNYKSDQVHIPALLDRLGQ